MALTPRRLDPAREEGDCCLLGLDCFDDAGVRVRDADVDTSRCEILVERVGVPLLGVPLLGGGIKSFRRALVRPDFLRPSSPMNDVGVCVVALFHGGDSSSFRFLVGFLEASFGVAAAGSCGDSAEGKSFGSGVAMSWPFSVKAAKIESASKTKEK